MAIYDTAQTASYGTRYGKGGSRSEIALPAIVSLPTANIDNANDEVGLFWAPAGFIVTQVIVYTTDMDSATALVIDIGDDADEDRLVAASTIGQTGASSVALAATGFLYKYTSDTKVKLYINTAAGTPVAGTVKVVLKGLIDASFDTTALVPFIP